MDLRNPYWPHSRMEDTPSYKLGTAFSLLWMLIQDNATLQAWAKEQTKTFLAKEGRL